MCGLKVSVQLLRYLALEVLWSCKVVPFYSFQKGVRLVKLKYAVSLRFLRTACALFQSTRGVLILDR